MYRTATPSLRKTNVDQTPILSFWLTFQGFRANIPVSIRSDQISEKTVIGHA